MGKSSLTHALILGLVVALERKPVRTAMEQPGYDPTKLLWPKRRLACWADQPKMDIGIKSYQLVQRMARQVGIELAYA